MGGEGSKTDVPGDSHPRPHPESGPHPPSESPGKATRERGLLTDIRRAEAGVTAPAQASSASQAEGSVGASK